MFKNTNLAVSVRLAVATTALAATAYSSLSLAQEATQNNVEKIQITGSRIAREGAVAPSPVTSISGEDLLASGVMNIGEALNDLPALAATFSLGNSGRYIGTAGLNILDLRGMGTDRTLVLVNGKRHVSSSAGSASVDTNTIPSQWVERVEIITGGASAVYGADAVTGVVNFILKENIEGLEVTGTRGFADNHSFNNEKYAASYGFNFAQDRGNFGVSVEYAGQDKLNQLDNPWLSTSYTSLAYESVFGEKRPDEKANDPAYPDDIWVPNAGIFAINDAGVYQLGDVYKTFNSDGSLRDIYTGNTPVDGHRCVNCDFFNLGQYSESQPEFSRWNINTKASYYLNDDTQLYAEAKYVNSEGQGVAMPAFFYGSKRPNIIKRDNAFLHPTVGAAMDAAGVDSMRVNRVIAELGRRIEDNTRETTRFVAGIKGLLLEEWDYDFSVVRGQTDLERVSRNNMVLSNYYNALDAIKLDNGDIVCRDTTARENGCVPINIMGAGKASQAAIDYINTVSIGTSEITQTVVTGTLANSDLYELPAGFVGVAAGIEYRKEESESHEPENAKGTFFNVLGEDNGEFDVTEIFTEVSVPVLADLPFAESVTVDAAVRYADYSTIGNATSWKVGADWTVNDQLRFRVTQSEAIRAPNISEIFGAPSQTFFAIKDPCKSSNLNNLKNSQTRRANCAALGVDADFDSNYDSARIDGLQSGNKKVNEEKSTSTTVGIVFSPEFFEGFVATVDYWKIELEDAIDVVDPQTILERCVDSKTGVDNQYCALITRNKDSEISLLQRSVLNVAGQDAAGVDFELSYNFNVLDGDINASLLGTYLIERKEYPFQEDQSDYEEFAGTKGEAEWQANFSLDYTYKNFYAGWDTRYVQEVDYYTSKELADNPNPHSVMTFGTYFVTDINVGYNFDSGFGVKLGIDNLFNRELPLRAFGDDAGSAAYDNIGRFAHLTVSYKM